MYLSLPAQNVPFFCHALFFLEKLVFQPIQVHSESYHVDIMLLALGRPVPLLSNQVMTTSKVEEQKNLAEGSLWQPKCPMFVILCGAIHAHWTPFLRAHPGVPGWSQRHSHQLCRGHVQCCTHTCRTMTCLPETRQSFYCTLFHGH